MSAGVERAFSSGYCSGFGTDNRDGGVSRAGAIARWVTRLAPTWTSAPEPASTSLLCGASRSMAARPNAAWPGVPERRRPGEVLSLYAPERGRRYAIREIPEGESVLVDYRRVTERFFAVSGVRDGEVYYSRCNFHGRMHCITSRTRAVARAASSCGKLPCRYADHATTARNAHDLSVIFSYPHGAEAPFPDTRA